MRTALSTVALVVRTTGLAEVQPGVLTKRRHVEDPPDRTGERCADGQPKVPDAMLERMKRMTLEGTWHGRSAARAQVAQILKRR